MSRQKDVGIVENFFKREGRLNRLRYFKRLIVVGTIESIILANVLIMGLNALLELSTSALIFFKVTAIAALYPIFCLMVRRLHDMDKDEKFAYVFVAINTAIILSYSETAITTEPPIYISFLNLILAVMSLYLLFCAGTKGDNQYGSDPLE
ncbi:MAG: DUF805 domain-containing protein [Selenomonadaceae bacterium]|nr:DUF805 domain-containing protein [Selenomonadaceae bacterium]